MEANFTVSWSFFMINIIIIFWRGIHFMELSWRYQKSHLFVLNTLNGCLCCSYHGADWNNLVPGKTEVRVLQRNGPCSGGSVPLLPAPSQTHFNPLCEYLRDINELEVQIDSKRVQQTQCISLPLVFVYFCYLVLLLS